MTFLVLALVGGALAVWLYLDQEVPVPGRGLLAAARVVSIFLIALLLWNPALPGWADADRQREYPWILIDESLSMTAGDDGSSPWESAVQRALNEDWGGVLVFGDRVRALTLDSLSRHRPAALRSQVEPALERAVEAGARRVVVLSDFRLQDARSASGRADALGVAVRSESMGTEVVNAGLAEVDLPAPMRSGTSVSATVAYFAESPRAADSLTVEVREEGRLVASQRVAPPEPGRLGRMELELPPPGGSGFRRYVASVSLSGDVFPDDDRRVAWVEVDAQGRGIVLVSLRPDWEPRFLLPVLERVSGLSGDAYLRIGQEEYLSAGEGVAEPGILTGSEVRDRLAGTRILVVHGLGGGAPEWVREEAVQARSLVAFPTDRDAAVGLGLVGGSPLPGEWYSVAPLPASPVAGDLVGLDLSRLPPLGPVIPLTGPAGLGVPLTLQRQGRGPVEAGIVMWQDSGVRRVVVLGQGLWRWGFREGPGREAYRRLWAGLAGWLLEGEELAVGVGVRPTSRVVERGTPVSWQAPGFEGDELVVRVSTARDSLVLDTLVTPTGATFLTPRLPPGEYSFRAWRDDAPEDTVGEGRFDVERFSEELVTLPTVPTRGGDEVAAADGETGRPLRTHPLPYLVVLGLLCAEWIGRRQKGLR